MNQKQILIMAGVGIVGFLWLRSRQAAASTSTGGVSAGTVGAGSGVTPTVTGSETTYTPPATVDTITKPLTQGLTRSTAATSFADSWFTPSAPLRTIGSSVPTFTPLTGDALPRAQAAPAPAPAPETRLDRMARAWGRASVSDGA